MSMTCAVVLCVLMENSRIIEFCLNQEISTFIFIIFILENYFLEKFGEFCKIVLLDN